jgi:glycosyltransferase involved in cell wall biosynthesis
LRGVKACAKIHGRRYEWWNPRWRSRYKRRGENLFFDWIDAAKADLYVISQGDNFDGMHWAEQCRLRGKRYVLLSQLVREWGWIEDHRFARARAAYQHAAKAFFVSKHSLRLTQTQLAMDIPNGEVVRNPFRVSYDSPLRWPAEDETFRLACVGRLDVASKGQDILLRIFASERWKARPVRVSFFGRGPHMRSLRNLRDYLGAENVEFGGFAAPSDIWRTHHAALLPSRQEGLPLALVEAMLCGRFGIASDVGGNREVIQDGVTGYIARGWQMSLFESALERAWQERAQWKSIGAAAGESIRRLIPPTPEKDFADRLVAIATDPFRNGRPHQ